MPLNSGKYQTIFRLTFKSVLDFSGFVGVLTENAPSSRMKSLTWSLPALQPSSWSRHVTMLCCCTSPLTPTPGTLEELVQRLLKNIIAHYGDVRDNCGRNNVTECGVRRWKELRDQDTQCSLEGLQGNWRRDPQHTVGAIYRAGPSTGLKYSWWCGFCREVVWNVLYTITKSIILMRFSQSAWSFSCLGLKSLSPTTLSWRLRACSLIISHCHCCQVRYQPLSSGTLIYPTTPWHAVISLAVALY